MTSSPKDMQEQCSTCQADLEEGQIGKCDSCIEDWAASHLKPISNTEGTKSISDDDLCSTCDHCRYGEDDMSSCSMKWPGLEDADGYVRKCVAFVEANTGTTTAPATAG